MLGSLVQSLWMKGNDFHTRNTATSSSMTPSRSRATCHSLQICLGNRKSDLEDEFEEFGDIKSIFVARNPPGFAYIEFYRDHDAKGT